jgi:hypothetical protein
LILIYSNLRGYRGTLTEPSPQALGTGPSAHQRGIHLSLLQELLPRLGWRLGAGERKKERGREKRKMEFLKIKMDGRKIEK